MYLCIFVLRKLQLLCYNRSNIEGYLKRIIDLVLKKLQSLPIFIRPQYDGVKFHCDIPKIKQTLID